MQTMIQINSSFRQTDMHSSKNTFKQKYTRLNQTVDKHTQTDKLPQNKQNRADAATSDIAKLSNYGFENFLTKSATGRKFFCKTVSSTSFKDAEI